MDFKKITTYLVLGVLAFLYCFGIETFKDVDMIRYFANGFYMTNYGMEGVSGYPNQLYSLFLYWGYHLTNNWYGLSNILFFPLYLFGIYSLYMVLNYFIKQNYISLLFTLLFLLVAKSSELALYFSSYTVYFFFFISIIYLAIYHPTKIYLLGFYFAIGSLFRNQIITFLPFIPFITNPKLTKKDYLKTLVPLLVALVVVQVGYEIVKTISIPQKQSGVNFNYYLKEIDLLFFKSKWFTYEGLMLFLKYNTKNYYFYLVLIPCFFMFNKKIANLSPYKPLLIVFLLLSLFIYFMPAIMYIPLGLRKAGGENYFYLLSRYSFIMIPLLIPIYHFIIKEQTFIKLNSVMVYVATAVLLLPILSLDKAPVFVKNTFTNISHKKELYGINSDNLRTVIKNNFKENAFLTYNNWASKIYVGPNVKSENHYTLQNNNIFHPKINDVDGVILTGHSYPYLLSKKIIYIKIYEEKADINISIYKKFNNLNLQ